MNILSFSSIISMFFECIFSLPFLFKDRVLIFFSIPDGTTNSSCYKICIKLCCYFFSLFSRHARCEVNCTVNSVILRIAYGHDEATRHLLQRFIMTTCKFSGRSFLNMSQKPLLDCFWSLLSLKSVSLSATL